MSLAEDGSRDPLAVSVEGSYSIHHFHWGCIYDAAQDVSIHVTEILLLCIVRRIVKKLFLGADVENC